MSEYYDRLKSRLLKFSKWNGECLESTYKARSQSGYALMKIGKTTIGAHRISWIVHKGEIPKGKWVLHKCDNPLCIRHDHLFTGTPKDNTKDMIDKRRNNFWGASKHSIEVVEKSIELRKMGKTHKEISYLLSIPMSSVNSFFRRSSLENKVKEFYRVPKYGQEIRSKAMKMHKSGYKKKEIQEILRIPKRTLLRIFQKFRTVNLAD